MYLSMLAFDVDSTGDDHHAARLVSRIPSAHLALDGTLCRVGRTEPDRPRGAILAYDDPEVAVRLAHAGGASDLTFGTGIARASLLVESIEATIEIALEPKVVGARLFALIASFDYSTAPGDARAAERHYLDYHVERSRNLPGLRVYVTGTFIPTATTREPRARMGIEVFDSRDALATSFQSPVGEEMRKDGKYLCANTRVYHLDCEVVL